MQITINVNNCPDFQMIWSTPPMLRADICQSQEHNVMVIYKETLYVIMCYSP